MIKFDLQFIPGVIEVIRSINLNHYPQHKATNCRCLCPSCRCGRALAWPRAESSRAASHHYLPKCELSRWSASFSRRSCRRLSLNTLTALMLLPPVNYWIFIGEKESDNKTWVVVLRHTGIFSCRGYQNFLLYYEISKQLGRLYQPQIWLGSSVSDFRWHPKSDSEELIPLRTELQQLMLIFFPNTLQIRTHWCLTLRLVNQNWIWWWFHQSRTTKGISYLN